MLVTIDNIFPWFGDMLELGGNILLLIIAIAAVLWAILIERVWYINFLHPKKIADVKEVWAAQRDQQSWHSQKIRQHLIFKSTQSLKKSVGFSKTLIKLCPLLGLLGTVLGMLEVFDAISITGSNSPRSTASGVSQAIFTTMAGMVIAISGLPVIGYIVRRIETESEKIKRVLSIE